MFDFREMLLSKSSRSFPGRQYNEMLEAISKDKKLVYELLLTTEGDWESFRDAAYPSFARYLKAKKLNPEYPKNIVISIFYENRCYELDGRDFIEVYKTIENLNKKTFHAKVKEWDRA